MILPDGYSDVPAGKIAAVVTHLEMTARPALPSDPAGAWTLRRVERPRARLVSRSLCAASARQWLWVSRIRLPDAELAAIIQSPLMEIYALAHEGRDEGLLEMDFREPGMRDRLFRRHRKTCRHRRRPLADEPRAGARMVAADRRASGCTPAPSIIPPRSPSISAPAFVHSAGRSRSSTIRGSMEQCRATWRGMCR